MPSSYQTLKLRQQAAMGPTLALALVAAPDDTQGRAYLLDLVQVAGELSESGVQIVPRTTPPEVMAAGSVITGEFVIAMQTLVPAACTCLGVWVQSRLGRKVRVKIGDIEAEASSAEELQALLAQAVALHANDSPKA